MMKPTFLALVTVLLLTSGMALASDPAKAQPATNDKAAAAAAPTGAAAATNCGTAPRAPVYVPKTREQIHAEAVEAAKNHRATVLQDLDFLKN